MTKADRNNNPICATIALVEKAGFQFGVDYTSSLTDYSIAKFIGQPVDQTLRLLDKLGIGTPAKPFHGMCIPQEIWHTFSPYQRTMTVLSMYQQEGGTEMMRYFEDISPSEEECRLP